MRSLTKRKLPKRKLSYLLGLISQWIDLIADKIYYNTKENIVHERHSRGIGSVASNIVSY